MRTTKLILLAMLIAFVSVTMAHAGAQVMKNQSTIVKASVQNNSSDSVLAAVKMSGYDDAGTKIGQLCKQTWLKEGKSTDVAYAWTAPNYATGVYWSAKVEVGGDCPNSDLPPNDYNEAYDSDSDSDSGADSDHH